MAESNEEGSSSTFGAENLLYYLETICTSIKSKDFQSICDFLATNQFIPLRVKEELDIMHESVPYLRKCRYLIWSVYHTIKNKDNGFDNFINALAELPMGRKLALNYYKKIHWHGKMTKLVLKKRANNWYELLKKMFCDIRNRDSVSNSNVQKCESISLDERDGPFTVLLEAQVTISIFLNSFCQWRKNDKIIEGLCSPLLCIRVADVTPHGIYEFYVGDMGYPKAILIFHINCLMDKYNQIFVERYKREDVAKADEDAWPQVSQNTYINLAIVKSQEVQNLKSCITETIRGDADDIHRVKGEINYKDAFEGINHGEVVIVEGRPGSGKTTLVHKISQDWGNLSTKEGVYRVEDKSLKWSHVKALFLVHLRGFCGNPSIQLIDIVKCYFSNVQTIEIVCGYITSREGAGICFILDGLDEYQPTNKGNFIFNLIEKKVLPKSIIIVASRPAAVAKYRSANKHIEVLGFFKEQISEYIDSYNFSDNSPHSKSMLKQYLEDRPNVYHMCYLPIQLAMVCFLFDQMEGTLPDTETAIYEEFTKHTVLRTLYRMNENSSIFLTSIFTMPKKEIQIFLSICTLAFDKTLTSKQVLEQSDVELICDKMRSSLGLVTVDRNCTKFGFQNLYTFCHLTFQEFLAACHIFMANESHQSELVEICGKMKHMGVVLKFFCGLVKFKQNGFLFRKITDSNHFNCLTKVQFAFESQQPVTCNHLVSDNCLNIEEAFLSARDWMAVGFVIIHADKNYVRKLNVEISSITEEGLEAFSKQTRDAKQNCQVEVVGVTGISHYLTSFLRMFSSLHILNIPISSSTDHMNSLFDQLNDSNLRMIQFQEHHKSKLLIKFDFDTMLKNLIFGPLKTCIQEETTCDVVLIDLILSCLQIKSDTFVTELKDICLKMCLSESCARLSLLKIDPDNIYIVAESVSFSEIEKEIIYISNQVKSGYSTDAINHKPDLSLHYSDFIPVGNYIINLCFELSKLTTECQLLIFPKDAISFVCNPQFIKKNYLKVDTTFTYSVYQYLEPLLQSQSISYQHRELQTLHISNFGSHSSSLSDILSQFNLTSCYNDDGHKFREDLQSLEDTLICCTKLNAAALFSGGTKFISILLASFRSQIRLSQRCQSHSDNLIETKRDCVRVGEMRVSGTHDGINFEIVGTPTSLQLMCSEINNLSSISYFPNFKMIQLKTDKKQLKLIVQLGYLKIVKFLASSLLDVGRNQPKSFSSQPKSFSSMLMDILINGMDTLNDECIDNLNKFCSRICSSGTCVRLSLLEKDISDNIFVICESLSYEEFTRDIEFTVSSGLNGDSRMNSSLLQYTCWIPIDGFSVVIFIDITDSITDFKILIFPQVVMGNSELSNQSMLRLDTGYIKKAQTIFKQLFRDSGVICQQLKISNFRNQYYPVSNIIVQFKHSLKHLELDSSCITVENFQEMYQTLNSCSNLISLKVVGKCTDIISDILESLSTTQTLSQISFNNCDIDSADFKSAYKHLCQFNLKLFRMSYNAVNIPTMTSLAQLLKKWEQMQELSLTHCGITNELFSLLTEGIKECKLLHTLDLSHNKIGDDGCKVLVKVLCHHATFNQAHLHTLRMCHCEIGDDGICALVELLLLVSKHLQVFDISHNIPTILGADEIVMALQSCVNLLEVGLEFEYAGLTTTQEDVSKNINHSYLSNLMTAIRKMVNIRILHLSNVQFNNTEAETFAEIIRTRNHLEVLKLSDCGINCNLLESGLVRQGNFRSLDLSNNVYTTDDFELLCQHVQTCKFLYSLNLSGAKIFKSDWLLPLQFFKISSNVRELYLDNTNLHSIGAYCVAEEIKKCDRLRVLSVRNCRIQNIGAKCLAEGAKDCLNIQKLDLSINKISKEAIQHISHILRGCQCLKLVV